jgi:hypothetical protein
MIRLGVIGGEREQWRDVARRLRGAALDPDAPPASADAVVFLQRDDSALVDLLTARKPVLLSDDALGDSPPSPALSVLNLDRYLPSRQLIHQQRERLGEPGLVRLHRWSAEAVPLARDLDVVLWLVGRTPNVVHALQPDRELLQVHLGFPGGGMALLAHASGPAFREGYTALSVIAASGAAYADDHAGRQLLFADGAAQAIAATQTVPALATMVQEWADALRAGADLTAGRAAWLQALAVRAAVTRSLATADAVPLEAP